MWTVIFQTLPHTETAISPDTAKEKPQEGEVVALGAEKMLENGSILALQLKEGDRILFGKYSGKEVRFAIKDYLILREDEIIGTLTQTGKTAGKK